MKNIFAFFIAWMMMFPFSFKANAWEYPLLVDICQISFNHGYSGNSLNIRKNASTDIVAPEFVASPLSPTKNERFAYIQSATPTVYAIFYSTGTPDPTQDLQIRGVAQNVTSANGFTAYTGWSLGYTTVHFPTGSSYSSETGFAVSPGTHVPTSIGKWKSKFSWQITGVGGGYYMQYLSNTTHDYYTVFDTPESPMTEPWTEVLDYSCDWANGATSKQNAATVITGGLYSAGFVYESTSGNGQFGTSTFALTSFVNNIGTNHFVNSGYPVKSAYVTV